MPCPYGSYDHDGDFDCDFDVPFPCEDCTQNGGDQDPEKYVENHREGD